MPIVVTVKNFQSIQSTKIVIDGFTAIYGPNNSGKTAIFRAIQGVFQNTRGTSFVRQGSPKCSVELDFGGGDTVCWEKGANIKPTYVVRGGAPIHPGQGVPSDVYDVLGVRPLNLSGNREVWPQFARQFTGQVFLLDQPGSVLAEAIADVERVTQLNDALKLSESDRRSASQKLKIRRSDRDELSHELEAMAGLDLVIQEFEDIQASSHKVETLEKAIAGLTGLLGKLQRAQKQVEKLEGVQHITAPDSDDTQKPQETLRELEALEALRVRWDAAQASVEALKHIGGVVDLVQDLQSHKAERVKTALSILQGLKDRWDRATKEVSRWETEVEQAKKQADQAAADVQQRLTEMGVCPTCGTEMTTL